MGKLNPKHVENLSEPGTQEDGDGLRLVVKASGSKSWLLRYQIAGRRRDMGLGSYQATVYLIATLTAESPALQGFRSSGGAVTHLFPRIAVNSKRRHGFSIRSMTGKTCKLFDDESPQSDVRALLVIAARAKTVGTGESCSGTRPITIMIGMID